MNDKGWANWINVKLVQQTSTSKEHTHTALCVLFFTSSCLLHCSYIYYVLLTCPSLHSSWLSCSIVSALVTEIGVAGQAIKWGIGGWQVWHIYFLACKSCDRWGHFVWHFWWLCSCSETAPFTAGALTLVTFFFQTGFSDVLKFC